MNADEINLGYLREGHPLLFKRWYFPSKVGGSPAWLDPLNLPKEKDLCCERCSKVMTFLLQVYSPVESEPNAFHRTLYCFVCLECKNSFKVFRCQLPLKNPYYATFPLPQSEDDPIDPTMYTHLKSKISDADGTKKDDKNSPEIMKEKNIEAENEKREVAADADSTEKDKNETTSKDETEKKEEKGAINEDALIDTCIHLCKDEEMLQKATCMGCGLPSSQGSATQISAEQKKNMEHLFLRLKTKKVEEIDDTEEVDQWFDRRPLAHPRCMVGLKHGSPLLQFPEYELVCEEEVNDVEKKKEDEEEEKKEESDADNEQKELEILQKYKEAKAKIDADDGEEEMDKSEEQAFEEIHEKYTTVDRQLEYFLERCKDRKINIYTGEREHHILRYALGGEPLYPFSYKKLMKASVPVCEKCGAERQFEMQIQPSFVSILLHYYQKHRQNSWVTHDARNSLCLRDITDDQAIIDGINRIEFGLVAVFTCSKNCNLSVSNNQKDDDQEKEKEKCKSSCSYFQEFLYVQEDPLSHIAST